MKEKERYELNDNDCIIDTEKDVAICDVYDVSESPETVVNLLNQQNKRIKELNTKLVDEMELSAERRQIIEDLTIENNQQDNRIKKLEKKLDIIRQKDVIIHQNCRQGYVKDLEEMKNLENENEQLKQQLAEKDKELSEYVKIVDGLHKQLSDKCDFCDKTKDQDKISFAVEKLRQVQKYIITDEKDMFGMPYLMKSSYIYDYIDNQIEELKKEMK